MLPKLIWNAGLVALTAALTMVLAGPALRGSEDREYDLYIKKRDGSYYFDPKPGRFTLRFHGQVRWNVHNQTPDQFTFTMDEFQKYAGDCPLDFLGNTGNTNLCKGEVFLAPSQTKPIKARRHRSDPHRKQVFGFQTKVNGAPIDPDIEIERDPIRFLLYLLVGGGLAGMLTGWWLGRKRL